MNTGVMMNLTLGVRFMPTDFELVVHYLRPKAMSLPLPAPVTVIPDFDVYLSNPNSYPGDVEEKRRFYFCKGIKEMISLTATGCGFWKTSGKVKQIMGSTIDGRIHSVGTRKLWGFYKKCGPHGWSRTPWVMHQFQLAQGMRGVDHEWGVYKVFQSKRRSNKQVFVKASKLKNIYNVGGSELPTIIDFKLEVNSSDIGPPEPFSSSSSATEMVDSDAGTGSGEDSVSGN